MALHTDVAATTIASEHGEWDGNEVSFTKRVEPEISMAHTTSAPLHRSQRRSVSFGKRTQARADADVASGQCAEEIGPGEAKSSTADVLDSTAQRLSWDSLDGDSLLVRRAVIKA